MTPAGLPAGAGWPAIAACAGTPRLIAAKAAPTGQGKYSGRIDIKGASR